LILGYCVSFLRWDFDNVSISASGSDSLYYVLHIKVIDLKEKNFFP